MRAFYKRVTCESVFYIGLGAYVGLKQGISSSFLSSNTPCDNRVQMRDRDLMKLHYQNQGWGFVTAVMNFWIS
jgi:hypothetical protein